MRAAEEKEMRSAWDDDREAPAIPEIGDEVLWRGTWYTVTATDLEFGGDGEVEIAGGWLHCTVLDRVRDPRTGQETEIF